MLGVSPKNFTEILKQAGAPGINNIKKALDTNKLKFTYNGHYYTLENDKGKRSTFKITTAQPLPKLSHLPLSDNYHLCDNVEPYDDYPLCTNIQLYQTAGLLLSENANKSFKSTAAKRYIFSFFDIEDSPIPLSKFAFETMLKHAGAPASAHIRTALKTNKLILMYNGTSYTLTDEFGRISHFNIESIEPLVAPLDTVEKAAEIIALADFFQRRYAEHKEKKRAGELAPYQLMDIQIAGEAYKLGVQEYTEESAFQKLRNHLNTPNGITAEIAAELLTNGTFRIKRASDDIAASVEHTSGITLHLLLTKADNLEKVKEATNFLRNSKRLEITDAASLQQFTSGSLRDKHLQINFASSASMLFKKANKASPYAPEENSPESVRWNAFLAELPHHYISSLNLSDLKSSVRQLAELAEILPQVQGLAGLFLDSNAFDAEKMRIIAPKVAQIPELSFLSLQDNNLDAAAATSLAEALPRMINLRSINLSKNNLDVEAMKVLVPAFVGMQAVNLIDLSNNHLTADGISVLFQSLHRINQLTYLTISNIQIDEGNIQAMGQYLEEAIAKRPDMPLRSFYMCEYPHRVMLDLIPPLLKFPNLSDEFKAHVTLFLNEQKRRVQNRKPVPYEDEDEDDEDVEEYLREVE